ncbi:flagellar biosynthesis anti-sigma factor FlgM [Geomonas subterranea]|uniref:Anti-sigma-28 factor n=1 Tax=Geomonas subterranea TaxID=2847989 RepID=A0ABX8LI12_9BACT|nr:MULTISPECIES: flagellar biosynthesis anti-sigma factor FlgM [Geomonas]QXE90340.1 flagellar biosynthesis anti-sigma factor FlgM [Geomonas subterranea]QXM07535.1 flagellar biosynthesis anti-sigma factor FlgM [Geomonas subterranea]
MRIEGSAYVVDLNRSQQVRNDAQQTQAVQGSRPAGRVIPFDRVEISPQAKELQKLKSEVAAMPDVRTDRVALAKQNLQNGSYRVEASALAQKMMDAYKTR